MISVVINGEAMEIEQGQTINDVLAELGLHPRLIVVEHNREILDRARFAKTEVLDGDSLELVHFVGGG